jgi:hypothetical protein
MTHVPPLDWYVIVVRFFPSMPRRETDDSPALLTEVFRVPTCGPPSSEDGPGHGGVVVVDEVVGDLEVLLRSGQEVTCRRAATSPVLLM